MATRIKTQDVVGALKAAGFSASVLSRRERKAGFKVCQINPTAVGVQYHGWGEVDPNYQAESEKFEFTLIAAGFRVSRPFPDKTLLGVIR